MRACVCVRVCVCVCVCVHAFVLYALNFENMCIERMCKRLGPVKARRSKYPLLGCLPWQSCLTGFFNSRPDALMTLLPLIQDCQCLSSVVAKWFSQVFHNNNRECIEQDQ